MKKKLLVHFATDRNGGEFRRIARLSKDSDKCLECTTIELLFLPIIKIGNAFDIIKDKKNKLGDVSIVMPILLPFVRYRIISKINFHVALFITRLVNILSKPDILWGETLRANRILRQVKGYTIADYHGASASESEYNGASPQCVSRILEEELNVFRNCDIATMQSSAMKEYLIKHCGEKYTDKCVIYNCGVDTSLFDYNKVDITSHRKKLGYKEDDLLFIYVGGDHKWQKIEESLLIFKSVKKSTPNAYCLILLAGDKNKLVEFCSTNSIDGVQILQNIPFTEVYKYISISDYAWLLRDNVILNQVASPTKLGEYLACGQVVISTEVSKSWSWLPHDEVISVDLYNPNEAAERILKFEKNIVSRADVKKKMREYAINNLSSENDLKRLMELRKNINI